MGDAALKLARRALASDGADGPRNAVQVLRYFVEREERVAKDTRVWAALHYLYGQLGESFLARECCKEIDALRENSKCMSIGPVHPMRAREEVLEVESKNGQLSAEAKEFPGPIAKAFERSSFLRAKATELFENNHPSQVKSLNGRLEGLLWKSRLLRQRGSFLVLYSDCKNQNPKEFNSMVGSNLDGEFGL